MNDTTTPASGVTLSDASQAKPKPASRLTTFRAPAPSLRMIKALGPVNRWLTLGGIPGLRAVPGLGELPLIRGLVDVPHIDFPAADQDRLRNAVNGQTAAFITPNHPEFFTDWMLDKEVLGRVAPLAACWATHVVVNGMGNAAQTFWLKNNLIAQIPGAEGNPGKEHSITWALKGHGVLLHPEGDVGWHGDYVAPLFTGAADMALEAARRVAASGEARPVFIAPVVWKLVFTRDVTRRLNRELAYVERRLGLPDASHCDSPAARLYAAYDALLARDEAAFGLGVSSRPYFNRYHILLDELRARLIAALDTLGASPARDGSVEALIRRGERWMREAPNPHAMYKQIRDMSRTLRQLCRMRPEIYRTPVLSQENVAEGIKRIRNDYCLGNKRDMLNKFLPTPAGPRIAIVRVPDAIAVGGEPQTARELTDLLRGRMQGALDAINADLARDSRRIRYPNPFA